MENEKLLKLYNSIRLLKTTNEIQHELIDFIKTKELKNSKLFVEIVKKLVIDLGLNEVVNILEKIEFNLKMNRLNINSEKIFVTFSPIYPQKFFYRNSMPLIIKLNRVMDNSLINEYIGVLANKKIQEYQVFTINNEKYVINNQISLGLNTKKENDISDFVNLIYFSNKLSNNSLVEKKINEKHFVEKKEYVVKKLKNFKEVEYEYSRNQYIVDEYKKNINDESACKLCNYKYESKIVDGLSVYNLHVHHIIPLSWENDFEKRWNNLDQYDNLIDLCPSCHSKIHFFDDEKKLIDIDKLIKYGINPDKLKQK